MTTTLAVQDHLVPEEVAVRPGSRADRMRMPLARDVLKAMAEQAGACVRPVVLRRTDTVTGMTEIVEVPCGARLAVKCKPCAVRLRRLRIQQIREGWHLAEEPSVRADPPGGDVLALVRFRAHLEFDRDVELRASRWDQVAELDEGIAEVDEALSRSRLRGRLTPQAREDRPRRSRSTRRRQDVPELPRLGVRDRTVGRVYTGRAGRDFRPSTLLTVTLPSHGAVHSGARRRRGQLTPCECGALHGETAPLLGTPLDPASYDYRAAALDAVFFSRVLDRLWQNLRRAAGFNVQYAGAVELQRRLAPHAHFAVRGTVARRLVRQVAAGTYHQVWWPPFDTATYTVDRPPTWCPDRESYVDPDTDEPLPSWTAALDMLDRPDAPPAYTVWLGTVDLRGINPGTPAADRSVRYVTKYLTKDLTEHARARSQPQRAHFDRLHTALSVLPCSPGCANWLLYAVQPDKARPGLNPGRCSGKVHQRATLGFTGRRVLISRRWSGKTLADHRADNRAWVRAVIGGQLTNDDSAPTPDEFSTNLERRYHFELARPDDPDVPSLQYRLLRAVSERVRWRDALRIVNPLTLEPTRQHPHRPTTTAV